MKLAKGIKLLAETEGHGQEAVKGSVVVYNARIFLRQGDELSQDDESIRLYGQSIKTRTVKGVELIDHQTILGKRETIAGIEKSLMGMKVGGYREVLVSPHLAYGLKGIPGLIPANAALRIQLWVQAVSASTLGV